MANRLTMHSGYRNAMGKAYNTKHIQREGFEKEQKGDTPPPPNVYWNYAVKVDGADFSRSEKVFYRSWLGPHVERQNKKNIDRRQYGRTQTVDQYREKHPPEEVLIYLGTENVDVAALRAVFEDFVDWLGTDCWDAEQGGVKPLDAALHLDETTPHVHLRQAYLYKDKAGDWQVSQNKALDVLGFQRPDLSKPSGKYNNAKMTFTQTCREKLFELARAHGMELVEEPLPANEVGLPIGEYVQRQQAREAAAAEQQAARQTIEGLEADIAELEEEKADVREELERSRKLYKQEQAVTKQKRKEAEEQGYLDGYKQGEQAGAVSNMGQLNAMMNKRKREQEEKEAQEQWQKED